MFLLSFSTHSLILKIFILFFSYLKLDFVRFSINIENFNSPKNLKIQYKVSPFFYYKHFKPNSYKIHLNYKS